MLRYKLAPALLAGLRIKNFFAKPKQDPGFRILLFHDVPKSQFPAFKTLIQYVKRVHGIITPEQAEQWLGGKILPAKNKNLPPCLISFDDGFVSNYHVAQEVLNPENIKALFFVLPGLTDLPHAEQRQKIANNIFDGKVTAEALDHSLTLMSWQQILELRGQGHSVGNHGLSHKRLSLLTNTELKSEIEDAADILESKLGQLTPWYAYAFGDINSITAQSLDVISSRHQYCRSGIRGLNTSTTSLKALLADQMEITAPASYQELVLEGGIDQKYFRMRQELELVRK